MPFNGVAVHAASRAPLNKALGLIMISLDIRLRTRRCIVGPVEDSDLEHVWTATRYPGFNDGMLWDAPASREEMIGWTERNLERWAEGQGYTLTARQIETGLFVGRIMVRPLDKPKTCRIGFWIHPTLWNQGYATEIARAAVSFAFEELEAETVAVAHAVWNTASARVIDKVGFTFSRDIAQGYMKHGQWVPEREYVMTRAKWHSNETLL
jgi:ribosomal-protein-alanine N-acetyltransferase